MASELAGQTALITGGGRGFGKAIAKAFAAAGAAVTVTARSTKQIDTTGTVDTVPIEKLSDDGHAAVLLRPDGMIAWAAAPGDDLQPTALQQALHTWFPQKRA